MSPANLDSVVEHGNLHSDGLFKSGLSEELKVFVLTHVIWHTVYASVGFLCLVACLRYIFRDANDLYLWFVTKYDITSLN